MNKEGERITVHKPHPGPETGRATVRAIAKFLDHIGATTMMEYKGYIARIEYDDSVGLLHGEVVNAASYPIATFEADDVEGLKREFRASIDDYLAWCKEDGVEPRRPFSGDLNLRLEPSLHRQVALEAAASGVSVNEWINRTLYREIAKTG